MATTERAESNSDIIVMGVSGCGKSTVAAGLAEHLERRFIEGDALHPEANRRKMAAGQPLDDSDRWPWLDRIRAEMASARMPVVIACSALRRAYRDRLRRADRRPVLPRPVIFLHLTAAREVIAQRMEQRAGHFMPVALLDSQFAALEPLEPDEPGCTVTALDSPKDTIQAAIAGLNECYDLHE